MHIKNIGFTCFEGEVICTTTDITLIGGNPDTVAGSGVGKTPVICARGDGYSNAVSTNDICGVEAAVSIYRNLILEFIIEACGRVFSHGIG